MRRCFLFCRVILLDFSKRFIPDSTITPYRLLFGLSLHHRATVKLTNPKQNHKHNDTCKVKVVKLAKVYNSEQLIVLYIYSSTRTFYKQILVQIKILLSLVAPWLLPPYIYCFLYFIYIIFLYYFHLYYYFLLFSLKVVFIYIKSSHSSIIYIIQEGITIHKRRENVTY